MQATSIQIIIVKLLNGPNLIIQLKSSKKIRWNVDIQFHLPHNSM